MASNLSQTTDADWNAINRRLIQRVREKSEALDAEGVAAEVVATMSQKVEAGQVSDPLAVAMSICDGLIRNGRRRTDVEPNDLNRFGDDGEQVAQAAPAVQNVQNLQHVQPPASVTHIDEVPRFYTWPDLEVAARRVSAENFWRTCGREWDFEVQEDFERLIVGLNGPRMVVAPKDLEAVRNLTAQLHSLLELAELPNEPGCTYPVRDWAKQAASKFLLENLDFLAQWGRGSQEESESAIRRLEGLVYALDEHDFLGTGKPAESKDLAHVAVLLGWAGRCSQSDEELASSGVSVSEYLQQLTPQIDVARAKYGHAVREAVSRWRCKREDFDRMRAKRGLATP
jgi:hypothetical protein